ncbi:hypothetical protein [Sessilibacter sp. MAH2]
MREYYQQLKSVNELLLAESWEDAEVLLINLCQELEKYFHHWHGDDLWITTTIDVYFKLGDVFWAEGRPLDALAIGEKIHNMVLSDLNKPIYSRSKLIALVAASEKTQSYLLDCKRRIVNDHRGYLRRA